MGPPFGRIPDYSQPVCQKLSLAVGHDGGEIDSKRCEDRFRILGAAFEVL
jgi:hypothetical protein